MKDWLFYPLAVVVIGAMIAFAMSFGEGGTTDASDGFEVSGEGLQALVASPGTTIDLGANMSSANVFAVLSANARKEDAPSAGVFMPLSPTYQKAFLGYRIRLTIEARSGSDNGTDSFEAAFFAPQTASGWQSFALTDDFEAYTFEFTPRDMKVDSRFAYFGIWPDAKGDGRTLHIRRMAIERVNPE